MTRRNIPKRYPGRRPILRGLSKNSDQPVFNRRIRGEIQRANRMQENGQHSQAAVIFKQIAQEAEDHQIIRYAPFLYMRAAQAFVFAEDFPQVFPLANQGIILLNKLGRAASMKRMSDQLIQTLRDVGEQESATNIQEILELHNIDENENLNSAPLNSTLPYKCPHCGSPLHPDEVNWFNKTHAECPYCGGTIKPGN